MEEQVVLQERVAKLEAQVSDLLSGKYRRNNTVKKKWRTSDVANMHNLSMWLKNTLFPIYKFLPKKWWLCTPTKEKSLCARTGKVVETPVGCPPQQYWDKKVVSMVNKKYVEMRSNINGACRKEYMKSKDERESNIMKQTLSIVIVDIVC